MLSSRPFTFDRVVRILGSVAIIVGAIWLINMLKDVLLPFCVACLISYMLVPIVDFNMRKLRLPWRILGVLLTIIEVTAVIGAVLYLIVPSVIHEVHQMSVMIDKYSHSGISTPLIPREIQDYVKEISDKFDIEQLVASGHLESIVTKGSSLVNYVVDLLMHTIEWLLTFIYVIFILLDYDDLMLGFRRLVPPAYRKTVYRIADDIRVSMDRYFRSQAVIALCAAVFYCVGFSIVGIPLAIVLGIIVGILYMIPYFQYVTVIPVIIVCFISSLDGGSSFWPMIGKCALVYVISQCICDYILTPKIMGNALGLNPAIILLSLSVWGSLMGIIGMIIALPMTALILAYYKEYVIAPGVKNMEESKLKAD